MAHEAQEKVQKAFDTGPAAEASSDGMRPPESLPRVKAPARRLAASDLGELLTKAKAAAASVERTVATVADGVSKIDSRWTPEARQQAADELRLGAVDAAGPHLRALRELVAEAEAQRPLHSPAVLARSATFSPDPVAEAAMRQSWTQRAAGADAAGLQALAILAASGAAGVNGVALAVVVEDALRRREDVGPGDRRAILDVLPQPPEAPELSIIEETRSVWRGAEMAVQELTRPGSTRAERLQSAFDRSAA